MSTPLAYALAGVRIRFEMPDIEMACTCGRIIAGIDERAVHRIHAEHVAEQRDPSAHELDPWGMTCA